MQTLLVTGRNGFVGRVLAALAVGRYGRRWTLAEVPEDLDIRDAQATRVFVAKVRPDAVVHLAAQSAIPESISHPEATLQVNVLGTLHLLQALSAIDFRGRLLYVGSGDVYGHIDEDGLPTSEAWLPRPRNPYAVSKLAAEALCWQWHVLEGRDVVLARPFNHIGPGQSDRFVVSALARQIAEIRMGRREPILRVGNLNATRDFTDVRDVAAAYLTLLDMGQSGEIYNVCSGVERSIRSVLGLLLEVGGVAALIEMDSGRFRPGDQSRMRGDCTKIIECTGWRPTTPLEVSLRDVLTDWELRLHG